MHSALQKMNNFAPITALCLAFAISGEAVGAPDSAAVLLPPAQLAAGRLETATASRNDQKVAPYTPRMGRARPLVAIVGDSGGTVLSDFVIPYGVMVGSGVADVVSVATEPGLLALDAVRVKPDFTITDFDQQYPDGADYVFVPAVSNPKGEPLSTWVSGQAAKGATMVSICNGSLVLANAGITRDHFATGHWSSHEQRMKAYPETKWLKNVRYVADGKVVSSAGITAAMPTAIAVVESIAGTPHADQVAKQLGVTYWGAEHNSDAFRITSLDYLIGVKNAYLNSMDVVGIPVADGVDEIAVAFTAEAYSNTLRSKVSLIGAKTKEIHTKSGLVLVADVLEGDGAKVDFRLPEFDATPSGRVPDKVLADITRRYGARTARFVVLDWEYPVQAP